MVAGALQILTKGGYDDEIIEKKESEDVKLDVEKEEESLKMNDINGAN